MNNWSTDSYWYYVAVLMGTIALWLWRDLREANERKNHLAEIAKNLSDRVYELEEQCRSSHGG